MLPYSLVDLCKVILGTRYFIRGKFVFSKSIVLDENTCCGKIYLSGRECWQGPLPFRLVSLTGDVVLTDIYIYAVKQTCAGGEKTVNIVAEYPVLMIFLCIPMSGSTSSFEPIRRLKKEQHPRRDARSAVRAGSLYCGAQG